MVDIHHAIKRDRSFLLVVSAVRHSITVVVARTAYLPTSALDASNWSAVPTILSTRRTLRCVARAVARECMPRTFLRAPRAPFLARRTYLTKCPLVAWYLLYFAALVFVE